MPRASKRVCAVSGCPAMQADRLCPPHRAERERHQRQTTPTKRTRTWGEQKRRKAAVDRHRATVGNWCPGYQRPAHPAADLTADHIDEISLGGAPDGELQVCCRSCNSAKAGRRQASDLRKS
ncbi:HNH endonuclease [Rhodococcus marinonascens]|uniref:HNH endonuclease n=1 Tax=Rhodococcus marinonascens TaxID=38311 RepID=UPI0009325852|nr:HNH endonuclease [Rhodococcus marinonascens]